MIWEGKAADGERHDLNMLRSSAEEACSTKLSFILSASCLLQITDMRHLSRRRTLASSRALGDSPSGIRADVSRPGGHEGKTRISIGLQRQPWLYCQLPPWTPVWSAHGEPTRRRTDFSAGATCASAAQRARRGVALTAALLPRGGAFWRRARHPQLGLPKSHPSSLVSLARRPSFVRRARL